MALNKHHILWLAWILFLLMASLAYLDVNTSRQGGFKGEDRSGVHLLVISITIFEALYVIYRRPKISNVSYICAPLIVWCVWILTSNTLNNRTLQGTLFFAVFILWWIFTLNFYAEYTSRHARNYRQIIVIFILLFFLWVFLNVKAQVALKLINQRYGITMFVYNIVLLFPFIFFIKSKFRRNACIVLGCFMVVMSLKRGAIVILPSMIFAYYFIKYKIEGNTRKIIWPTVIFAVLLGAFVYLMNDYSEGLLSARFDSEQLESGSGRNELRAIALQSIAKRDFLTYLIGSGGGTSVELLSTGVHNEWVEAYFSYGLIGVIIYGWMVFRLFKYTHAQVKEKNRFAPFLAMYCTYLLLCTMFSGFMFMHTAFYYWAGLGFLLGLISKNKKIAIA